MMRALGAAVVLVCACGGVKKQSPDAGPKDAAVDSPVDAFNCTAFPVNATFTYSPPVPGINSPVTFTPATAGLTYAWTFADGTPAMSADAAPQVTWTAVGQHQVQLSVVDPNTQCTGTSKQDLTLAACTPPLASPPFTQNTSGHANSGIVIVPSRATTLTSVTFLNQGMADTINLTDSAGTILQTLAVPASTPTFQGNVSWPLSPGVTYHIVGQVNNNGRYANYTAFPTNGPSLAVTAGWMDGAAQSVYWFSFVNLVTCP